MDLLPLPPVTAADAARFSASAHAQRRAVGAGFGAALDAALTRPADVHRPGAAHERAQRADLDRDDEDRIAATQQSVWLAAREARAAESRPKPAGAERFEHSPEDRRVDAARGRTERTREDGSPPTHGATAAAVAAARRLESARTPDDIADRATEERASEARAVDSAAASKADVSRNADGAPAVHDIERSMEALAPQFRTKLERVIARMEAEGHDVAVTETQRDPARQNQLYEQGRSRPGPVVTWTRNSNHLRGMAADLVVDGSYDNPAGYARLAQIAAEEGLHTLGARDAGHVELRAGSPLVRTATATNAQQQPLPVPATLFGMAQVAAVAEVAAVAQIGGVAPVAQVAGVAQIAQPGSYAPIAQPATIDGVVDIATAPAGRPADAAATAGRPAAVEAATQLAAETADGARADVRRSTETGAATHALAAAREAARSLAANVVAALGGRGPRSGDAAADSGSGAGTSAQVVATPSVAPTNAEAVPFLIDASASRPITQTGAAEALQRADVTGRMERVQALQDAAATQPLSQVTLRVDGEDGSAARIQVGLRGNIVGAAIDTADPLAAASMRAHVAELRQALERQGLDASSLLVRMAARLLDGSEAGRLAGTLASADALASLATSAARESSAQRDHTGQSQQHSATRRDADAQRQRQNRNDKEDRP